MDGDSKYNAGCFCAIIAFAMLMAFCVNNAFGKGEVRNGIFGIIFTLVTTVWLLWLLYTDIKSEKQSKAEKLRREEEIRRKQEEYKRRMSEEECKREAADRKRKEDLIEKIKELRRRPLQTLSSEALAILTSEYGEDGYKKERFYIYAVQLGNKNAEELLVRQAEERNPLPTPQETIAHCDEINDLIANAMCYYRKGLALRDIGKVDEAIDVFETAISVDDAARREATKLTVAAREDIAKVLPLLKKKSRKVHIEKDGHYNLVKTGIEYEDFVCGVIRRMGYACKKTPATDQGVDLVVSLKNGKKLAVQCKFLSVPVSNSAVQEVVAGKALYNCSHACVVGKSGYTKAAIELAVANNVRLMKHDEIHDYIFDLERK